MSFNSQLQQKAQFVDELLKRLLASQQIEGRLQEALSYTISAPGKRLRSVLVLWCCELISGKVNHNAEIAAAAIEMVHTYSLVHDDLPAMDNDDLRRGQPTCHKAFNEATAILTGDALLTFAFEILAKEVNEPAVAVKLISQLAHDAGPTGMIAGQIADLEAENGKGNKELLEYIHTNKTAKMFRCATVMGAICGGATDEQLEQLSQYGLKIGLSFQIADDILDVSATSEHLGKTAGKDAKAEKCTYPSIVGIEKAKELEKKLAEEAMAELVHFGTKANNLRQLVMAMLKRTR
jgi:geranylgeranyl diphosphate synthase type II